MGTGAVVLALLACTAPEGRRHVPRHTVTLTTDTATTSIPTTSDTGKTAPDTGTVIDTADPACSELPPPGPLTYYSIPAIQTEEDFDFDQAGNLIAQQNTELLAITHDGARSILSPGIGADAAGIRSLPSGDVLVAQPDTGTVRLVTWATGGSVLALTGLTFPNGLEVGTDGMAYVSEYNADGRVRTFDPLTGEGLVLLEIENPNGLALSPDEQTLYVATSEAVFVGDGRIAAIDRGSDGAWDPTTIREVYAGTDLLDALAVDVCGNLYVTEYSTGRVFRLRVGDGVLEPLVDLPGTWSFSAARFGNGRGGWERTHLFVSNRSEVFGIDVGVPGRHVLASDAPDTGAP